MELTSCHNSKIITKFITMQKIAFLTLQLLLFLSINVYAQTPAAKENKGSFPVNFAKATEDFFTRINDEVFQLKYVNHDKAKNTYYFTGNIPLFYKDNNGVGNSGFTIGNNYAITDNAEKTESGGYFAFDLSIKITGSNATFIFSHYIHKGTGAIGNGGQIEGYPECGSDRIGGIPKWDSFKKQADTESENIVNKLKGLLN
jgi:hypothetical protein